MIKLKDLLNEDIHGVVFDVDETWYSKNLETSKHNAKERFDTTLHFADGVKSHKIKKVYNKNGRIYVVARVNSNLSSKDLIKSLETHANRGQNIKLL